MLGFLKELWSGWTGDRYLEQAIRAQLRRQGYAVHAATIRDVRLVAVERPGWVQICRFWVETTSMAEATIPESDQQAEKQLVLYGLSRDDGRRTGIKILLTEDAAECRHKLDAWSEGMIRRGN